MRKHTLCGLLVGATCLVALRADAQTRSADVHFFRPALYSGGIFGVDRAAPPIAWQPSFKFFFNHEQAPLRLNFPGTIGEETIIEHSQVFNLQGAFGISKWLEFGIDLPIVRHTLTENPSASAVEGFERLAASDPASNIGAGNVSPLDLRLGLKFNILHRWGLGLAVSVEGTVPLGDEEAFAGEKGATLQPRLLASLDVGRLSFAVNIGYRFREQTLVMYEDPNNADEADTPLLNIDDELTFAVGGVVRLHRMFSLGLEFYGALPITGEDQYEVKSNRVEYPPADKCSSGWTLGPKGYTKGQPLECFKTRNVDVPSPVVTEIIGGLIFSPKVGLDIAVGGGAGITGDERRVSFRLFSGISWSPGAVAPTVGVEDRDRDGVPDGKDECPSKPEDKDGHQDSDGCPDPDNDGDGILDGKDKCPNQAEDRDGTQDEDGCPDEDNDGDGILDAKDKCPDKPEDKDNFQDDDGCPDDDNDGDGIADKRDQCPNEQETINKYKDKDGCPDTVPGAVAIGDKTIKIPDKIRFRRGKAVIDKASFKMLDKVAQVIRANPRAGRLRIEGHCDNSGTKQANQKLSQDRAGAVKAYLVKKGVPDGRLTAAGYGDTRPIAPNNTKAGRSKNRRVEFIVIKATP